MTTTIQTNDGVAKIEGVPDYCPHCHKSIHPVIYTGIINNKKLEVIILCPNRECLRVFLTKYEYVPSGYSPYYQYKSISLNGTFKSIKFSNEISNISQDFVKIYNESYSAEQSNLLEICGVGYRKALEFLVKDYAKKNHPQDEDAIEKMLLGACVDKYVVDTRIKEVTKRAVWLGNDETHYIRKWENKNLDDLKNLIGLAVNWINSEELYKKTIIDMPN